MSKEDLSDSPRSWISSIPSWGRTLLRMYKIKIESMMLRHLQKCESFSSLYLNSPIRQTRNSTLTRTWTTGWLVMCERLRGPLNLQERGGDRCPSRQGDPRHDGSQGKPWRGIQGQVNNRDNLIDRLQFGTRSQVGFFRCLHSQRYSIFNTQFLDAFSSFILYLQTFFLCTVEFIHSFLHLSS